MDADKPTVIDRHASVQGELKGRDAHVLGQFRGEIELTGRLVLGEGARVEATVVADSAEIAGDFKGELTVRSLLLLEKARIDGSLQTQTLSVREGAQLNGPVSAGTEPGRATSKDVSVPATLPQTAAG